MRIKRLVVAAGVLLVAAIAAIAIAVHFLAPRTIAALAESIRTQSGRELDFGEVGVTLLPHPAVELQQVRFGNAAWGSQPWLAEAGRVSVEVDALALLSRRLHFRRITVADASVLLETGRDGNDNWAMGLVHPGARAHGWFDTVVIDELTLRASTLSYRNSATGKTLSARVDSLDVSGSSASDPMHVNADTVVNGTKVTAAGTVGALAALIANAPAYPVDLSGNFGAASVGAHGTVGQPRTLATLDLALRIQAPDIAKLATLFGAKEPWLGPLRGTAQLTGSATAPIFKEIDVELGAADRVHVTARGELQGNMSAGGDYEWQSTGIDLVVEGSQLADLSGRMGRPLPPLGRYRIAAHAAGTQAAPALSAIDVAAGGGEMPEIRLSGAVADARAASGIDLKIAANAADWWRSETMDATLPPFALRAHVRDAGPAYRVDDLELKIADTAVSASLQVVRAGSRLRISGSAKSPLIDLARRKPANSSARASTARVESQQPADWWKLADVDLDLDIGRLVLPGGRRIQAGSGRIALVDGQLQASAVQATLDGAKLRIDGSVADPQDLAGLDLKVALQGNELAEFLKAFGKVIPAVGPYQGRAELRGSRKTLVVSAIDASAGRNGQSVRATGTIEDARNWRGLKLTIDANINDSPAAGRVLGIDLPRLPAWKGSARLAESQGGYVFDEVALSLGRTSMNGRIAYSAGEPRPRVTATLGGPLLDLSVLPALPQKSGGTSPLLAADIDADLNLDRIVLPDRRELGPVRGSMRLAAGALELKQFSVALDGATATIDGRIDDPVKPAGFALMFDAKLVSGAGIARFTGFRGLQQLPAFGASGKLTDVADGYALAGLKLALAAAIIDADASMTRGAKRFALRVTANTPLLAVPAPDDPASTKSAAKPVVAGARAIPDVALPLDLLRAIDADLDLRAAALKFGDAAPLGPLRMHATIADGRLAADQVQLDLGAGQSIRASATVDATQTAWTLRLDGSGIDLGGMIARLGSPQRVIGGSTELGLELQGQGKSLQAIAGSLDGEVWLKAGPSRITQLADDTGQGLFLRLFGAANPFKKTDPDTDVSCIAARLPVKHGVLTSQRNIAVETPKYNLVTSGTINLRTEALDLAITPIVTSGLATGHESIVVQLGGTLAAPAVGITPVSAFKSAASAGILLTIPIAQTLFGLAKADPNPCATAFQKR